MKEKILEETFYKWKDIEHKYHTLFACGAGIVQNPMELPVEEIINWKRNMYSLNKELQEDLNKLLSETVIVAKKYQSDGE